MRQCGVARATDDCRRRVDQRVVDKRLDHEQGEIDPPRHVAGQYRVTDVRAPHWQPLALTFLQITAADHRPAPVAVEYETARCHLIVEIERAGQPPDDAEDLQTRQEAAGIAVLAIAGDVPAAGDTRRASSAALSRTAGAVPDE